MNMKLMEYLSCGETRSFNELLFSYIDKSGYTDAEVYKKALLDRKLFSKIRCSKNYTPHKNTIIKLGMSLELNRGDFDKLLKSAGYSLSDTTFDKVISYCLDNRIYNLMIINDYLYTACSAKL